MAELPHDRGSFYCPYCKKNLKLPLLHSVSFSKFMEILAQNHYNRRRAADALGVTPRTVRSWIEKYRSMGIEIPNYVEQIDTSWVGEYGR